MNNPADGLLAWMSHLGGGSESQLISHTRSLLFDLSPEDCIKFLRVFRRRIQELGHATWDRKQWFVEPPTLSLLPSRNEAIWRGGRVQSWTDRIVSEADRLGCTITLGCLSRAPTRFLISGGQRELHQVSKVIGLLFEEDAALRMATGMQPLRVLLASTAAAKLPTDQPLASFDYTSMEWIEDSDISPARRYMPRRGERQYFVEAEPKRFISAPSEAEAIYLGAILERRTLCDYDPAALRLTALSPLPIALSRPLCLCNGKLPQQHRQQISYDDVPPDIGWRICHALNSASPQRKIRWI